MCVVVALGVFAVSLTLCGCSPYNEGAYVDNMTVCTTASDKGERGEIVPASCQEAP